MLPIHTILHPTDYSERAEYAFRLACALAKDHGARLVVLHVAIPPTIVYGEGVVPPVPPDNDEHLWAKLEKVHSPIPNVVVERQLEQGEPIEEILRVAGDVHADMIVMGTHGRTGLRRLLMGSVAEQVVRKASCPVLTVKTPFHEAVPVPDAPLAEMARCCP